MERESGRPQLASVEALSGGIYAVAVPGQEVTRVASRDEVFMNEERGGLSGWLIGAIILAIVIALLWFFTPFGMFIAVSIQMTKIHREERRMQRPEIFVSLA